MLTEGSQNSFDMLKMHQRVLISREDGNVVAVHNAIALFDMLSKNVLHEALKAARHIGQAKRSCHKLEEARRRREGRFVDILLADAQLMKTRVEVNFGEPLSPTGLSNQIGCSWCWEPVAHGLQIQATVINAQAQFTILFGAEQHRCSIRREATAHNPGVK